MFSYTSAFYENLPLTHHRQHFHLIGAKSSQILPSLGFWIFGLPHNVWLSPVFYAIFGHWHWICHLVHKRMICHTFCPITFFWLSSTCDIVNFGHHCVLRAKRCRKRPGTFKLPRRPASKIPLNHLFTFTFCHFTKMAHFGCKDFFWRTFCIFSFQKSFFISKVVDR